MPTLCIWKLGVSKWKSRVYSLDECENSICMAIPTCHKFLHKILKNNFTRVQLISNHPMFWNEKWELEVWPLGLHVELGKCEETSWQLLNFTTSEKPCLYLATIIPCALSAASLSFNDKPCTLCNLKPQLTHNVKRALYKVSDMFRIHLHLPGTWSVRCTKLDDRCD